MDRLSGPLPKEKRHPADYRDEIEHAEVAAVLAELPDDHPARTAYYSGTLSDSLALSHLLSERMDLVNRLIEAYFGHGRRIAQRSRGASAIGKSQG